MPLKLSDMLKKAASKGMGTDSSNIQVETLKPWQDESILLEKNIKQNESKEIIKKDSFIINNEKQSDALESSNNYKICKFTSYNGWQRELIIFFYNSCLENKENYVTQKLSINDIKENLDKTDFALHEVGHEISTGMIKSSISRLKTKNAIALFKQKKGRAGWCKYKLEESLFSFISQKEYRHGNKLNKI